jgi:protein-disulfide isomerase
VSDKAGDAQKRGRDDRKSGGKGQGRKAQGGAKGQGGTGQSGHDSSGAAKGKRAARDRLAAERAKQRPGRSGRGGSGVLIAVIVTVVIVGIIGYAWWASNNEGPDDAALPTLVQDAGGGVVLGDGPVDVALWEDFQCPGCKLFEESNGDMLRERVEAGDITMTIHPLSFLDDNLSNDSSVLAANAFGCATDAGEQQALDFHLTVYGNQPPEVQGQPAWSAEQLIGWGGDVGIEGGDWESCVNDLTYGGWVTQVQTTMSGAGITQTPTVFLDGEKFDLNADDLDAAIDEALNSDQ